MEKNLEQAIEKIRSDKELTKKFIEEPKKVLENLGVDTQKLKIEKGPKAEIESKMQALRASVCVSIGEIVCVSVGT